MSHNRQCTSMKPARSPHAISSASEQPGDESSALHFAPPLATRHSPFVIRHSPFVIRHSPFAIRHSPFAIRHSSFAIRHSSFVIRHSSLVNFSLLTSKQDTAQPGTAVFRFARQSARQKLRRCFFLLRNSAALNNGCLRQRTVCGRTSNVFHRGNFPPKLRHRK